MSFEKGCKHIHHIILVGPISRDSWSIISPRNSKYAKQLVNNRGCNGHFCTSNRGYQLPLRSHLQHLQVCCAKSIKNCVIIRSTLKVLVICFNWHIVPHHVHVLIDQLPNFWLYLPIVLLLDLSSLVTVSSSTQLFTETYPTLVSLWPPKC